MNVFSIIIFIFTLFIVSILLQGKDPKETIDLMRKVNDNMADYINTIEEEI